MYVQVEAKQGGGGTGVWPRDLHRVIYPQMCTIVVCVYTYTKTISRGNTLDTDLTFEGAHCKRVGTLLGTQAALGGQRSGRSPRINDTRRSAQVEAPAQNIQQARKCMCPDFPTQETKKRSHRHTTSGMHVVRRYSSVPRYTTLRAQRRCTRK